MSWTPAVGFEVFGALVSFRGPAGYSPGQVALSRLWSRRRDPEGAPQRRRCSGDPRSRTRGPGLERVKAGGPAATTALSTVPATCEMYRAGRSHTSLSPVE